MPMDDYGRGIRTGEYVYYMVFGIYLTLAVLQTSFFKNLIPKENLMNGILLVCVVLLVLRELLFETVREGTFLLLLAAGIFAGNALISGTLWTAFPFLLIFCGRHINLRRLFLFTGTLTMALIAIIVVSSYAGLIENYQRIEVNRENNREYLGFLYALFPGFLFFNAAAVLIAAWEKRIHFIGLILLGCGALFLYRKTDGRLAFVLTALLILFALLNKLFPDLIRRGRYLFFLTVPAFPVCAAVSVILTYRFNENVRWMYRLDNTLNHRLKYGLESIRTFGVRFIGTNVHWVGYSLNADGNAPTGDYLYVDNMYVNFLQRFGLAAFILAVILVTAALWKLYRARRFSLLFIFLLLTIHGLMDDLILQLAFNTFWIAAAQALAGEHIVEEDWNHESINGLQET